MIKVMILLFLTLTSWRASKLKPFLPDHAKQAAALQPELPCGLNVEDPGVPWAEC